MTQTRTYSVKQIIAIRNKAAAKAEAERQAKRKAAARRGYFVAKARAAKTQKAAAEAMAA